MGLINIRKDKWLSYIRLAIIALSILMGLSSDLLAANEAPEGSTSTVVSQNVPDEPKVSEIIPLAAELSARLARLEHMDLGLPDLAQTEKNYFKIETQINSVSKNLEDAKELQKSRDVRDTRFKLNFAYENEHLKKINQPLNMAIEKLATEGEAWQVEKQQWQAWRSSFKDRSYSKILTAFDKADLTITTALEFISRQMEPLLAVQSIGARIKTKIDSLEAEATALREAARREPQFDKAPPIYSLEYFAQFNSDMWSIAWEKLKFVQRPGKEFYLLHSLELGVLVIFLIVILAVIFRNREAIAKTESWSFVADRPFATVLFITSLIATVRMQYWGSPSDMVEAFVLVLGSMSCLRLLLKVLHNRWAKVISSGVMSIFAITLTLMMTGLPAPIFNLFIMLASTLSLVLALKLIKECILSKSGPQPLWVSRALALWFAVILIAEVLGDTGTAYSMFVNSVITMAVIALIVFFIYLLRGGIHWVFFLSPLWQLKLLRSDAQKNERKVQIIIETVITLFLIVPATLSIWGLFDGLPDALSGLFSPGFEIGGQTFTVGLIFAALAVLYGSFYASQLMPKILLDEQVLGRHMDRGVRGSIGHLIRYLILFIGLLMTFSLLGFSLTNVTIILSALGVGIGFGLQGIVNNFVSGLILLFERPIREGDTIEMDQRWAQVKKIGMRATIIETFDMAEMVIPNADMINNHVTNWTLSNRQVRLTIPVGVDYGSDVSLVADTILACAQENASVLKSPAPEVLFLKLGDSSLNFELRAWIQDFDNFLRVKSQIYHEVLQRFRELGITIPFPQRDVHLYGMGNPVVEKLEQPPDEERTVEGDPA